MKRYLIDIKADDKPVLLERVLRVVRHRGFIVKQVAGTQNHESKIASVEIIVDSDRPISFLTNQIEKLWDVKSVNVTEIATDELPNNNSTKDLCIRKTIPATKTADFIWFNGKMALGQKQTYSTTHAMHYGTSVFGVRC